MKTQKESLLEDIQYLIDMTWNLEKDVIIDHLKELRENVTSTKCLCKKPLVNKYNLLNESLNKLNEGSSTVEIELGKLEIIRKIESL